MKDIKIVIRGTKTYKQVSKIVPPQEAYNELLRVVMSKFSRGNTSTDYLRENLVYAFDWDSSPQGRAYWKNIWAQIEDRGLR